MLYPLNLRIIKFKTDFVTSLNLLIVKMQQESSHIFCDMAKHNNYKNHAYKNIDIVVTLPLPRDGGMSEDQKPGNYPRPEQESYQRASGAGSEAGQCRMR